MPHTVAKRYKVPQSVVKAIDKAAAPYGSKGRAIQVATEILVRMGKLPKIVLRDGDEKVGMTYKLTPRTIELIDELAEKYGGRGHLGTALAACAKILSEGPA